MFKRKNRFSFKKSIPNKVYQSKSFVLRYSFNDEFLKVAVVVGKKVDKRATQRNKIKRVIVKNLEELLDKNLKSSIIIFARKQILEIEPDALKNEIKKSLEQCKII